MRFLISMTMISILASCSFLVPRKSSYDYLTVGQTNIKEVKEKSGRPDYNEYVSTDGQILVYGYCPTSYIKEGFMALLTFGLYATSCNLSYTQMRLFFDKNGTLVQFRDNTNVESRAAKRRSFARGMSAASKSMEKSKQQRQNSFKPIPTRRSTTTRCTSNSYGGPTTYTDCTSD